MLISTKGRYALRIMLDLAQQEPGAFIPLPAIAERQEASEKYLESIISTLARAGLVEGQRGKGGGYRLARKPCDYSVGEILRLAACLGRGFARAGILSGGRSHALPEGGIVPDAAGLGKIRVPDLWLSRRSHADKPARRRRRDRRLPKREKVNILCCFHKPIDKVGFCAMINP